MHNETKRRVENQLVNDSEAILAEHFRQGFIRAFGAARFEVWLGKDGASEHTAPGLRDSDPSR
jgi:hypothetical protein